MPRLRNTETGLVVSCEGDLAERYQSRGWVLADAKDEPAVEVASEEPQEVDQADAEAETPDEADEAEAVDEKPARRGQARRR